VENRVLTLEQKLDSHILEFKHHVEKEDERWDHLVKIYEENSKAIADLSCSISDLSDSTEEMVEVYNAASGAVKVGAAIGKFAKWLTSVAVLGAAFAWLLEKFES